MGVTASCHAVRSFPVNFTLNLIDHSARKTEYPPFDSARDLLRENPYTPTSTVAQAIMNASPLLSELIVIREWLQETAPAPQHPEATTGYWTFTKHNVVQAARTAAGGRSGLVKELDPDAVNRGDGRALASDDAVSYSRSYFLHTDLGHAEL